MRIRFPAIDTQQGPGGDALAQLRLLLFVAIAGATPAVSAAPTLLAALEYRFFLEFLLPPSTGTLARFDLDSFRKTDEIDLSSCSRWLPAITTPCFYDGLAAGDVHGRRVYLGMVGTASTSGILVYDTVANAVVGGIPTQPYTQPSLLIADPFGPRLLLQGSFGGRPSFALFDTRTLGVIATTSLAADLDRIDLVAFDGARSRIHAVGALPSPKLVTLDATTLQVVATAPLGPALTGGFSLLRVSADGATLVIGDARAVAVVDAATGKIIRAGLLRSPVNAYAYDPARNRLFLATEPGTVTVIDVPTLLPLRTLAIPRDLNIMDVRQSDGALLVDAYLDEAHGALTAIDVDSGQVVATNDGVSYATLPGLDGEQLYRLRPGGLSAGSLAADMSDGLSVVETRSLRTLGTLRIDTRPATDPTRDDVYVRVSDAVTMPKISAAVEYVNDTRDHYFVTANRNEIELLDQGMFVGWRRTGESIGVHALRADAPEGVVPVCRFYGRPEKGLDTHFYSASPDECLHVAQQLADEWTLESFAVFQAYPADPVTGQCRFATVPVYRVYNNRADTNHRYTTSPAVRVAMLQRGWIAEGYGPDAIAFCVPR